jgi:hypothetical protein|tara:strand:- start:9 stop:347 length:339 start_codon:yes stop_codon:yes gene_type:complete
MKVVVSYACELEDIPQTVSELLGNLKENSVPLIEIDIQNAISYSNETKITEALESINECRVQLSKIDNSLMDYGTILAGYSKTIADIQLGNDPTQINQEENNVNIEAEKTND